MNHVTINIILLIAAPIFFVFAVAYYLKAAPSRPITLRFALSMLGLLLLACAVILLSNSIDEEIRNLLAFEAIPAALGALLVVCHLARHNQSLSNKKAIAMIAALALLGFAFIFVVSVLEMPVSFTFTLLFRIPYAKSATGVPIREIVKINDTPWETGGHFHHACGTENLLAVRLEETPNHPAYYFAYFGAANTLVPLSDETAAAFPALLPPGDTLVGVTELATPAQVNHGLTPEYYGAKLELPEKWFRSIPE